MPIADPFAADILTRIASDMVGPMAAGARVEAVPLGAGLILELTAPLREAAMFLALRSDLDGHAVEVRATLEQPLPAQALPPLIFAGWSEAGSVLPLHLPGADPATETVAAFRLSLRLFRDGTELAEADALALVEGRLVSGRMGRLMALIEAETIAIRRHARAIAAARHIETASAASLDRHGGDLGVPRQTARLTLAPDGTVGTLPEAEPDAAYRARLALYRAVAFPRPAQYAARLGPDGPLAAMGFTGTLNLVEAANPVSLAVTLISVDSTAALARARRDNFVAWLRDWVLIDLATPPPAGRRTTTAEGLAQTRLRHRLAARVTITAPDAAMAPELARALDRAAGLLAALGVGQKLELLRALDPAAGARFGLGLGLAIAPPDPATLDAVFAAAAGPPPDDPGASAAFSALVWPKAAQDDPLGGWIFRACGFRTVHLSAPGELFLSHLDTGALTLAGDTLLTMPAQGVASEPFLASFAPEAGAAASQVIVTATAVAGATLPGTAPVADPAAVLAAAVPANAARSLRLRAAGLPAIADWEPVRAATAALPADAIAVLSLPAATAAALLAGDDDAWTALSGLVAALRRGGVTAALPLFTATGAALLIATAPLPVAGANLTGRAATFFRWFAIPLDQAAGPGDATRFASLASVTRRTGASTEFRATRPGLFALVVLGYQRLGGTDPFEVRIEAGADDLMTFPQYEFLMNLLSLRHPAGVEINTWPLRRFHVAADDGTRTALDPSAARTWRPFRHPRRAGTA